MAAWLSWAHKQPLPDAGSYTGGRPKLLWHTTEGSRYPGTSLYHGTHPTFTCDFKRRVTYQHVAMNRAARALAHPSGTGETNRDNVVQVELVGFTSQAANWTLTDYAYIARLARAIERAHGVPRRALKPWGHSRLSWSAWHGFAGHCGHMHAPGNDHVDPGPGFRIDLVLANPVTRVAKWTAELARNRKAVKKLRERNAKLIAAIKKATGK